MSLSGQCTPDPTDVSIAEGLEYTIENEIDVMDREAGGGRSSGTGSDTNGDNAGSRSEARDNGVHPFFQLGRQRDVIGMR